MTVPDRIWYSPETKQIKLVNAYSGMIGYHHPKALDAVRQEAYAQGLSDAASMLRPAANAKEGLWSRRLRKLQEKILSLNPSSS